MLGILCCAYVLSLVFFALQHTQKYIYVEWKTTPYVSGLYWSIKDLHPKHNLYNIAELIPHKSIRTEQQVGHIDIGLLAKIYAKPAVRHKNIQSDFFYKQAQVPAKTFMLAQQEYNQPKTMFRNVVRGQQRIALVIGNANYRQVPSLTNPINDAYMVAEALRRLDFEVTHITNVTRLSMEQSIREFIGQIKKDAVALFYFAGHGVQVTGRNFLIPTDARLSQIQNIEYDVINLKTIIQEMELSPSKLNLLVIDACRDNPWLDLIQQRQVSRRYLPVEPKMSWLQTASNNFQRFRNIQSATGTLIAFATAENQVAADGNGVHSPYTAALLRWIEKPNIEVGQLFREVRAEVQEETNGQQVPWENGAITGEFYFNMQENIAKSTPQDSQLLLQKPPSDLEKKQQEQQEQSAQKQKEEMAWQAIQRIKDETILVKGLEQYLEDYPDGEYTDLARLQLLDLKKQEEAPQLEDKAEENSHKPEGVVDVGEQESGAPQTPSADKKLAPPALLSKFADNLDQDTRVQIQESLAVLGLYRGLITGDFGPQTNGAIYAYQQSRDFEPTGFLTPSEMVLLFADAATKLRDNPEKEKELRKEKGPTWYVAATPEGKLAYVYGMLGDPEKTKVENGESDGKVPTTTDKGGIALLTSAGQANGEQGIVKEVMTRPDLHSWAVKPPPAPAPAGTLSYRVVLNSIVFNRPARYEKEIGYILPGSWVHVTGQVLHQNWFQIRSADGKLGYVETYALSPKPHMVHSYSIDKRNPNTPSSQNHK